ncbi:phosphopantetheine-binding protein [Acrocarpospora catenulata]|uniref:phosphopantetheine-binding protein n=1 Tax=Acrocarpospora catenulata TaxID=2836182 RepID=UPI001BD9D127|nr:phosphopantetheine-binding protein [Acrocarpospora catenulata]
MTSPDMTPTESAVAEIWTELLGQAPPSTHDDFFELGGQSLTMVQFLARVEEQYGVELPIDVLFASGFTVAEVAKAIDEGRLDAVGDEELAELLKQLEGMSDEEISELLSEDA